MLGFFDKGSREDSRMSRFYKEQLVKFGPSWLQAAQDLNDERCLEDILMVTGSTCVRSWVTGVVHNETADGEFNLSVSFMPSNSGVQVSSGLHFQHSRNTTVHHGPAERLIYTHDADDKEDEVVDMSGTKSSDKGKRKGKSKTHGNNESSNNEPRNDLADIKTWSDQCIFIRGYHMKARRFGQNVPKKLRAAAEPQDPSKDKEPDQDNSIESIGGSEEAENGQVRT